MKAEKARRDLRDNVAEIADRARDLSAKVKERLDETYNDLNRTVGAPRMRLKIAWMISATM